MTPIEIKVSGRAFEVLPRIADRAGVMNAIARTMDRENLLTTSHIQRFYLSFPSAAPATLDGLRVQTGAYRRSLRPSLAVVTGDAIRSAIGTNQLSKDGESYPAVHEFGADIPSRPTRSQNKSYVKRHPNTKAFALPARAPIQRGIADRLPQTSAACGQAIINFWEGAK